MPNRKAKERKQTRREKNEYLKRHGRTRKQIARFKKNHPDESLGGNKKW